jgi:branched-chain amino acid transport system ATP-binding protein
MEALKVECLSKQFGGVRAVNDVSFDVAAGERLAIIGPNGAGKTSLFNLINGQLSATSGTIQFFNEDVTNLPVYRRAHLGMARAFQIISLLGKLTVLDNALLTIHGTKPHRYKMLRTVNDFKDVSDMAVDALKMLDLWDQRDEPVSSLAYGVQRRLEIGLGLAMKPRLLLLDEPSAGLTKEESLEIIEIVNSLGQDITVLIVDHDMDMVFEIAERIIVLHYGRVILDGTPEEVQGDQRVKEIYMGVDE